MAIQMRRGASANFVPESLLPGEWAIVLEGDDETEDGCAAYICFSPSNVKRIVAGDELEDLADTIYDDLVERFDVQYEWEPIKQALVDVQAALEAIDDIVESAVPLMTDEVRGGAKLGSGLVVASGALCVDRTTTEQVDNIVADETVTGYESLSTSGLAYFWGKLKTWAASTFAALAHSHAASDIASGTLGVDRGGTGSASASDARTALGITPSNIGAAASSHTHAATDVTSGQLAVANGGTGLSASPSMLTDLASTTAADVLASSPRPGVTGTLPVANGGTGAGTAADARTSLEITPSNIGAAATSHTHDASDITGGKLVIGAHNVSDPSNASALIVGNGTADDARSDAFRLGWDGIAYLLNPDIERGTPGASDVYSGGIRFCDKDGDELGYMLEVQRTGGAEGFQFGTPNAAGTDFNTLEMGWDGSTPTVYLSKKDAWLAALGLTVELTTTASAIAAASTGFTINSAAYTSYGKVATLRISLKTANAIGSGDITNTTVATMVSGKRPKQNTPISTMSVGPVVVGYINGNGGIVITATHSSISANESFEVGGTFILA